jgi:hypothetical protein
MARQGNEADDEHCGNVFAVLYGEIGKNFATDPVVVIPT